jgi:hypothetical protein
MLSIVHAALKEEVTRKSYDWIWKMQKNAIDVNRSTFLTAEKIFDARWAMTVVGEAMRKLSEGYATTVFIPLQRSRDARLSGILFLALRVISTTMSGRLLPTGGS